MGSKSPILLLEDDPDDRDLLVQAMAELPVQHEFRHFSNGQQALFYLMDTSDRPLLILSDINMPGMDGLELRRKVNESHYLHRKSIPFVFFTTSALPEHIIRAYDLMVDGYFVKPDNFEGLKRILRLVLDYWVESRHPNDGRSDYVSIY